MPTSCDDRQSRMSQLEDIAQQDGWRCWVCDEPVDPATSVNDPRGPSVDSRTNARSAKKSAPDFAGGERLAHRSCNTKKGAVTPVIPWPAHLVLMDPAPLIAVAERLDRKGGREVVVRCADRADARQTADWLVDRFSRLAPALQVDASIDPGGGQFVVALTAARRR
ncbi:hypothetical protein Cch02nite_76950 [Catellatospora chokoriensis]|uniref:Uncharacterized protein n=2 Tax=Catellatospora chokoriensis TaxID=310353 RepID=A0A8J3K031_9ACTN|nr:hypothetical protein Cch02nite_76950 [Catellatospora chokoriensis]